MTHTRINTRRRAAPKLAALALLLGLSAAGSAQAVTLFSENFEGYNSFPNQDPLFDPVNSGIAKISEGANEIWYGARFEHPTTGSNDASGINSDIAIQKFGGGTNNTHTGRTEDDAGMLFKIDTVGLSSVNLSFDWRTFSASWLSGDRFVAGYRVGPLPEFGSCSGNGEAGCFADLRSGANSWDNGWTELLRVGPTDSWHSENYDLSALSGNAVDGQSEVWIAFWLDNGEGDYAKFDNVLVTAVPEADTYAMLLAGLGLVGYSVSRRKRGLN